MATHICEKGPQDVVVIITSSVEGVHGALEIVQRSVAVPVTNSPVTPEVGEFREVMVAVPETTDHVPVLGDTGVFPAKVAMVASQAGFISVPASAVVGSSETLTEAVLVPADQPQLLPAVSV
jgi:hypothetical protein